MRFDVSSEQPVPYAPDGVREDTVIFNQGPYAVYLGSNTSLQRDPESEGIRVPALTYKEWRQGAPLWFATEPGENASVIVGPSLGGLLTAPIGQTAISVLNKSPRGNPFTTSSFFSDPVDLSRFDSFSLRFKDGGDNTVGTSVRKVFLSWALTEDDYNNSILTDTEEHWVFCQGGVMHISGRVKAPILEVFVDDATAAGFGFLPSELIITGYLTPVTDGQRVEKYWNVPLIGGTLVPSPGTVSQDGSGGVFRYSVTGLGAAAVDAFWITNWAGPAHVSVKATTAIATTPVEIAIQSPAAAGRTTFEFLYLPVSTATRQFVDADVIFPQSAVSFQITNNSSAAVNLTVSGGMQRHD